MSALRLFLQLKGKFAVAVFSAGLSFCVAHSAMAAPAQTPLFLAQPVKPIMMLNMSNDHQLFFKIYDDYADITRDSGGAPDGEPDRTYINAYKYYGYFDENKCYTYNTDTGKNRFEPSRVMLDGYCNYSGGSGEWSGNFLNWASMTRIDAVRKILYGGLRSLDTGSTSGDTPTVGETVLERALLPNDAHAFAKFYDGADIDRLTPFTVDELQANTNATGITICNTTNGGTALSQDVTSAPLLRVARGNYTFWASNERYQCRWGEGSNGNVVASSGVYAYDASPANVDDEDTHKLGTGSAAGEFHARVQVCVPGMFETNCSNYPSGDRKPTGLLQKYGENERIAFGLMTGSYGKSKSGGVLRKPVGSMANEINKDTNGTFTGNDGIIKTLDSLRIYGYRFSDGTYHNDSHLVDTGGSDGCKWGYSSFINGQCTNWGNPQAEMFLESLRYLAGKSANTDFTVDDSSSVANFKSAAWGAAPVTSANYCAPLNVLQFNASSTSYDGDELGSFSDLSTDTLATWTNKIADSAHENLNGSYFIGKNGTDNNELCTAKTISSFAGLRGTCPDAPRLEGSYHIAGLAYFARQQDIMPSLKDPQNVRTFGVALSPAVPKAVIPVPGSDRKITILPACRNTYQNPNANCAIVDFKIVSQTTSDSMNSGRLYVNWEDSEQGGDYDQDMWGVIDYEVTSNNVKITTNVIAESTSQSLGFGYVVNGTTADGFYVHSGVEDFTLGECNKCQVADAATSKTFTVGTSEAKLLETPLHYAAKWGGYANTFVEAAKLAAGDSYDNDFLVSRVRTRDSSDSYHIATDPRRLEASLETVFAEIEKTIGGAATVAANSTRLELDTLVYQAKFDSGDWSGEMVAYPVSSAGVINTATPVWTTHSQMPTTDTNRRIFTYDGAGTKSTLEVTAANWNANSLPSLKAALMSDGVTDDFALNRLKWIRGDRTTEQPAVGLRERNRLLGDIVNSDPAFSGANDMRYSNLPTTYGSAGYAAYVATKKARTPMIFVGANDGMLHAFNANTGAELFAYIPTGVFPKLAALTRPDYQHQYYVDGPMFVGDVYFDNDSDGLGGTWKTVLVGSLGAGGRGIFALDVSNPLAPEVLFDISAGDGSPLGSQLGYITGQPLLVPTGANNKGNGVWAVVVGNGVESINSVSKLLAIDIEDPSNVVAINTQAGTGLSAPALLPNNEGVITTAYAGDLTGRMWRFDLTDTNLASWSSYFKAGSTPAPLFTARDATGTSQPITASPTLGYNTLKTKHPSGAPSVMVYFGTGKYLESADNNTKNIQSFYGIADVDDRVTTTIATKNTVLHKKTILTETADKRTIGGDSTLTSGVTTVDWPNKSGWYINLVTPPGAVGTGERVVSKPRLLFDRLLFTTFIPSAVPCEFGGSGWLMELTGVGDKYVGHSILGALANTPLTYGVLGSGGLTPILSGEKVTIPICDIKGDCSSVVGDLPAAVRGRMSWRQLR